MDNIITKKSERIPGMCPWAFDWSTTEQSDGTWTARTPYREVLWTGDTEKEAIGAMLRGVCELSRDGKLDPEAPSERGVPPIQHTLQVLGRALEWHTERRREQIAHDNTKGTEQPDGHDVNELVLSPRLSRLNEIISGLATSIAALARVKEL